MSEDALDSAADKPSLLPAADGDPSMKLKEIPEGTILIKEQPFVYILSSKFRSEHCDFCFKAGQLSKCAACKYVYYCGKACQREGWAIHKLECKNLKKVAPKIVPDAARLLARLIKILQRGGDQVKGYYTEKHYRKFKDLISHYPDLKVDQKRMEHLSSLYGVLYEFLSDETLPNSAELMGLYGRMCVNSFNICNPELQSLGTGIYLGASILDHSCCPNALATFQGTTLYVRNLERLDSLDFSKIFISYIDVMATTKDRQTELLQTYYFLCQCAKCLAPEPLDEMNGAACPNRNCDNYIPPNSTPGTSCSKCHSIVSERHLEEFREVIEFTEEKIQSMKHTTYLDVCKVCLAKHRNLVYKFNLKHLKILDLAFESCIEFQQFDEAVKFGLELINGFHKYYGNKHPLTGLLHLKLGKILLYQNRCLTAKEHIQKAEEILRITHGKGSNFYKEEVVPLIQQII